MKDRSVPEALCVSCWDHSRTSGCSGAVPQVTNRRAISLIRSSTRSVAWPFLPGRELTPRAAEREISGVCAATFGHRWVSVTACSGAPRSTPEGRDAE